MNPNRVDSLVDLAYGVLILAAIVLMVVVETAVGAAFGIGVFVAYAVHVVWKMARYDPDWMTREIAEQVETDLVEDVTERVEETVAEDVSESVEEVKAKVEEVNERVDRRPRADEIAKRVDEQVDAGKADGDQSG